MKNQTLEIEIPEGFMIDTFDAAAGKIKLKEKPKNVMDKFKTIDDVILDHWANVNDFNDSISELEEDEKAYIILKMIAESLNEGWKPDWKNSNESKYYAYFDMGGSSGFRYYGCAYWSSTSNVGSRLCFKSRELAEYAGKQFTEVYKQFMVIE